MQDAKNCRLGTITQLCQAIFSQLRHVSTIRKKLVKQQYLLHMSHNMVNFSLLAAEIVLLVWGTTSNFNVFCILASLLQRRRSMEGNQTLHSVWPLPELVGYIYIFGDCCSITEFCHVKNSICVLQVSHSPIGSVTARQSSSR